MLSVVTKDSMRSNILKLQQRLAVRERLLKEKTVGVWSTLVTYHRHSLTVDFKIKLEKHVTLQSQLRSKALGYMAAHDLFPRSR